MRYGAVMTRRLSTDVARVIRGLLAERQITTKDFAAAIGLPNSTVDRWLKGGKMSTDALDPLAQGLNLSVEQLVALALAKRRQEEAGLRSQLSPTEQAALDEAIARKDGDDSTPQRRNGQERRTGS